MGELIKRLTLVIRDAEIVEVLYPIFPSNSDAEKVASFLEQQRAGGSNDKVAL